jgi:hypothetical protein
VTTAADDATTTRAADRTRQADRAALLAWLTAHPGWCFDAEVYRGVGEPRGLTFGQIKADLNNLDREGRVEHRKNPDGWRWQVRAVEAAP